MSFRFRLTFWASRVAWTEVRRNTCLEMFFWPGTPADLGALRASDSNKCGLGLTAGLCAGTFPVRFCDKQKKKNESQRAHDTALTCRLAAPMLADACNAINERLYFPFTLCPATSIRISISLCFQPVIRARFAASCLKRAGSAAWYFATASQVDVPFHGWRST